jgi:macrocin-O-methyltransferase TylF-like protien
MSPFHRAITIARAVGSRLILGSRFAGARALRGQGRFYAAFRPDADTTQAHPELRALASLWVKDHPDNAGDLPRLYSLVLNIKQVLEDGISGDLAELGVYRGHSAAVLASFARAYARQLHLFDTCAGFDRRDFQRDEASKATDPYSATSIEAVRRLVGDRSVTYVAGRFPESLPPEFSAKSFAVVHLDCDLYEPTKAGLAFFYPRLAPGGLLIAHDYGGLYWEGVKRALDEFAREIPERPIIWPDKSGTAAFRKVAAERNRSQSGISRHAKET